MFDSMVKVKVVTKITKDKTCLLNMPRTYVSSSAYFQTKDLISYKEIRYNNPKKVIVLPDKISSNTHFISGETSSPRGHIILALKLKDISAFEKFYNEEAINKG